MLSLFLLLATVPLISSQGCPFGMTLSQDASKCYQFLDGKINFGQTEGVCASLGEPAYTVASIHNKEDNEAVRKLTDGLYYLGGRYNSGKWSWTDGSPFDFSNWIAGGGNPQENDCIVADSVTGLWKPFSCSAPVAAVCATSSLTTITQEPTGPCDGEKLCYKNFGYDMSSSVFLTWPLAEKYCQDKFGGHLASIHSIEEEKIVEKLMLNAPLNLAFLGGVVQNGTIVYSDGSPYDYEHFFSRFPLLSGLCLQMYYNVMSADNNGQGWVLGQSNMEGLAISGVCKYPIH